MPIDHIGGLSAFPDFGMHAAEADWLTQRFPLTDEQVRRELLREPCAFPEGFRPENYRVFRGAPARLLSDGEETDAGGRRLIALHTPGHSPGTCVFSSPIAAISIRGICSIAAVSTPFIRVPIRRPFSLPCAAF